MATEGCEPIVQNRPTPDLSVSDIKMPTYTRQENYFEHANRCRIEN